MTIKVPDVSERTLLDFIRASLNVGCKLRLFRNDIVPSDADVASSYQEAIFPGYAPVTLPLFANATTVGGVAQIVAATQTFVRGSGGSGDTIYGYFVTDNSGTTLFWSERDPGAPVNMVTPGNSYAVSVLFQFLSQF